MVGRGASGRSWVGVVRKLLIGGEWDVRMWRREREGGCVVWKVGGRLRMGEVGGRRLKVGGWIERSVDGG